MTEYCKNGYTYESNLQIHYNPHKNANVILHRNRKIKPKLHMEAQKAPNSQSNPEKKSHAVVTQYLTSVILQSHSVTKTKWYWHKTDM
jgi:hypothetical protein